MSDHVDAFPIVKEAGSGVKIRHPGDPVPGYRNPRGFRGSDQIVNLAGGALP